MPTIQLTNKARLQRHTSHPQHRKPGPHIALLTQIQEMAARMADKKNRAHFNRAGAPSPWKKLPHSPPSVIVTNARAPWQSQTFQPYAGSANLDKVPMPKNPGGAIVKGKPPMRGVVRELGPEVDGVNIKVLDGGIKDLLTLTPMP